MINIAEKIESNYKSIIMILIYMKGEQWEKMYGNSLDGKGDKNFKE